MGAGGTAAGYVISHLVEPCVRSASVRFHCALFATERGRRGTGCPYSRDGSHCWMHAGEIGREPPKAVVIDIPLHTGGRDAHAPGPYSDAHRSCKPGTSRNAHWAGPGTHTSPRSRPGILLPLASRLSLARMHLPNHDLASGGFRRQHTVVQIRKRVINLFDCSQCRLIGVIEHIALRQFAHVPASRQVHPRTVRFAGIVSSS